MSHPLLGARIAHVGVAVEDADAAAAFYRDVLGLDARPVERADGAKIVSFPLGEADVELLEPEEPESPVARFLTRRGPGIHHICYRVPDLEAALARAASHGYRLLDAVPRPGAHGRRVAFLHPKSTAGVLIELTE